MKHDGRDKKSKKGTTEQPTYRIGEHDRAKVRLYEAAKLKSATSLNGSLVELVRGRLGRVYGARPFYAVKYSRRDGVEGFDYAKVIIQTPDRREAKRVYRDCLKDKTTGGID
jgi:hypothetical protein